MRFPAARPESYEFTNMDATLMPQFSIFSTDLGWFGVAGQQNTVTDLLIGHSSADEVRHLLKFRLAAHSRDGEPFEADWWPELRRMLQDYSQGAVVDFSNIDVDLWPRSPFQKRVLAATRAVSYGETTTYGQLAARAGSPRAARAVGQVMASNRVPLLIPCHRVVASAGRLGGFSAPQGVSLKSALLKMESQAIEDMTALRPTASRSRHPLNKVAIGG